MGCVSKTNFVKPAKRATKKVALPECGDDAYVVVKELGSRDLLTLQKNHGGSPSTDDTGFVYELLALALVDDEGNNLFANADEVKDTFNLGIGQLEHLISECLSISGVKTLPKNEVRQS